MPFTYLEIMYSQEEIKEHYRRRDSALYGLQRHLIQVSATVLGILIALKQHGESSNFSTVKSGLYVAAISAMTLGLISLALANRAETDVQNKLIRLKQVQAPSYHIVEPARIFYIAEYTGYVALATGLVLLSAFAIASEFYP